MMATTTVPSSAPEPLSPRFTLELEFVLSLSNPDYLTWLGVTYPYLLNPSDNDRTKSSNDDGDAAKFARYLAYLYAYWKTPKYSQFLTHPAATLRNLELLQQDRFRRDMISLDVREKLRDGFAGFDKYNTEQGANEIAAAATAQGEGDDGTMEGEAGVNGIGDGPITKN